MGGRGEGTGDQSRQRKGVSRGEGVGRLEAGAQQRDLDQRSLGVLPVSCTLTLSVLSPSKQCKYCRRGQNHPYSRPRYVRGPAGG